MDDIMTVEEVGEYLHLCKKTIYQLAKQGSLPVTRVGNNLRFYRSEIDHVLKRFSKHTRHILVIDDAPAVCSLLKDTLEDEGHMVFIATNGADGLECMKDIKFDNILLDLRLDSLFISLTSHSGDYFVGYHGDSHACANQIRNIEAFKVLNTDFSCPQYVGNLAARAISDQN